MTNILPFLFNNSFDFKKPLALEIEEDRKDAQDIVSSLKPKPIIEEDDDELE